MNRYHFLINNLLDKFIKLSKHPSGLKYYYKQYLKKSNLNYSEYYLIISYPKSGRTWIREILNDYFVRLNIINDSGRPLDLNFKIKEKSKAIKFYHHYGEWAPLPQKKGSCELNSLINKSSKIIFLSRDIKDTLLSSWYHLTSRERIYKKNKSDFVKDKILGVPKIMEFYKFWIKQLNSNKNIHHTTYEKLHNDTLSETICMLNFFDLPIKKDLLIKSIKHCEFKNMQQRERNNLSSSPWLSSGSGNINSMKSRKGQIGQSKKDFDSKTLEYINHYIKSNLSHKELEFFE